MQNVGKKTKIIATIGPASNTDACVTEMIKSGADVFRLNASHESRPEVIQETVKRIRKCAKTLKKTVGIFLDLQGPKIRIGKFSTPTIKLEKGMPFTLTVNPLIGDHTKASVSYKGLVKDVKVGDFICIDDGNVRLEVLSKRADELDCIVRDGGVLSNHKGINLPQTDIAVSAITEKDKKDAKLAVENDLDYVALSFVSSAEEIRKFRAYLQRIGGNQLHIIAKIERPAAVKNIESIIETADAIMVARGDLGIEVGLEFVPEIQKRIIRECNRRIKPVIVATQMLESMVHKRTATRAEVSDVANAIYDHCDAVMLSGETAVGIDPAHAIHTMEQICQATDRHLEAIRKDKAQIRKQVFYNAGMAASFCKAADQIAEENQAQAILAFTSSGNTPLIHSKLNPLIPIFGITDDEVIVRRMTLYRGVIPLKLSKPYHEINEWRNMITLGIKNILGNGWIEKNDKLVVTAGIPIGQSGGVNSIRLVVA